MTLFELLDQPFNIVHEMYRLVFLKNKMQREKEERDKLQAEEKAKAEEAARRDQLRRNVPAFATKSEVFGPQTPPQQTQSEKSTDTPKPGTNDSTRSAVSDSVVSQMISSDMQEALEEVIS